MLVSVVIPAHNRAYILPEAIRSAIGQTYDKTEVLIVDDGSKDDTRSVVGSFRDARVRYFRHEKNRGVSAARNTAIREAKGECIAFLDSDDVWTEDKLETQTSFLMRHPTVDLVFSDAERFDGEVHIPSYLCHAPHFARLVRKRDSADEMVFSRREMLLTLVREIPIKPTTVMVRTGFLRRMPSWFKEDLPSGSDWELFLRMSELATIGYINRPLATVRIQKDATHRVHLQRGKTLLRSCILSYKRRFRHDSEIRAAVDDGVIDLCRELAWHHESRGDRLRAARAYARAFLETYRPGALIRMLSAAVPFPALKQIRAMRTGSRPTDATEA